MYVTVLPEKEVEQYSLASLVKCKDFKLGNFRQFITSFRNCLNKFHICEHVISLCIQIFTKEPYLGVSVQ